MESRRDPRRPISKRKQLLVEGRTPELFFEVLAAHLRVEEIEIRDFHSNAQLTPFLKAFCARPEFKEKVTSLAIIRDAEFTLRAGETQTEPQTARQAFQSVCSSLSSAGQSVPGSPGAFTATAPKTGVFILPNCQDQGMLETLCLESVVSPGMSKCTEQYFACMKGEGTTQPRNMTKARTFAFLATKDIYDPLVGRTAQKGIWPWHSPAFQPLKQFLLAL
jgi:hypothetical protein